MALWHEVEDENGELPSGRPTRADRASLLLERIARLERAAMLAEQRLRVLEAGRGPALGGE